VLVRDIPKNIKVKKDSIAIIGFHEGGAGQIYEWIKNKYHVACFVNYNEDDIDPNIKPKECKTFEYPKDHKYKGLPLISSKKYIQVLKRLGIKKILVTVANEFERYDCIVQAKKNNIEIVSFIHPSVHLLEDCKIDKGVILFANVTVGYKAEVREGAMINTGCSIDHHSIIKKCATLDPGVITAGNVIIEKFAHLHTGVVLINNIKVGEGAIVGAGAVVIKNIKSYTTNVGIPSKGIKINKERRIK
jgi:sugar O-acyltransferase (sialic acid O-acetyltransferase NeuD family)